MQFAEDVKKMNKVTTKVPATATVNFCKGEVLVGEEMVINHT